jgi:hypothetical protein
MRRIALLVSSLTLALITIAGFGRLAGVTAQDATPMPSPQFIGLPPGVVGWEVGDFTQIPSTYRLQLQPGATLPASNGPELSLVYVESGEVTLKSEGPLALSHRDASASPEIIPAGTDFTAKAGDYFVEGLSAPTKIRNESDKIASLQFAMMDPLHPIIVDPNQTPG